MPSKPTKLKRPWVPATSLTGIVNRTRDNFYHTNAWKKASRNYLDENPLCVECKKKGRLVASEVTDHIIQKDICQDPWDQENWQPLCKPDHAKKSATDKKYFK